MESSSPKKSKNIGLIILSVIDVVTGVLSLIITAFAVQVIALMASGLTLIKAVKIAVQSEKAAVLVKPVAVYAVRKLTRSEKMRSFFGKIKDGLKNNPITIIAAVVELAVCGVLGYESLDFVGQFEWAVGWKSYALAFGAALVVYVALLIMTIYLGYDNSVYASIRKLVKVIGGEKAVEVLDKANEEVVAAVKEAEERKAAEEAAEIAKAEAEAARVAEEQRIYEYALKREEEKKAAAEEVRRRQLINAYKGEFESAEKNSGTEVVNNANPHNV